MKNNKLNIAIEIAIFSAIAVVLDMVQSGLFKGLFASGGSIGIAMVPVLIIAYRRGFVPGIVCGLIVSLLQMLSGIYVIQGTSFDNPFMQAMGPFIQVMLDYVLAYTLVGFAGLFSKPYKNSTTKQGKVLFLCAGSILGGFLKYLSHVLSGILFWLGDGSSSFWGASNNTHLYSWVYNGAYSIPNIILCTIIMVIIGLVYGFLLDPSKKEVKTNEEENI